MDINEVVKLYPKGFSINVKTLEVDPAIKGVFVSLTNNEVNSSNLDSEFRKILKAGNLLNSDEVYVGYYMDENKKQFLDISVKTELPSEAISLGLRFNQKEIYDCNLKESIKIQ